MSNENETSVVAGAMEGTGAASDVEDAFTDGRLYIEVDEERGHTPYLSFEARPPKWDGKGRIVRVISRPAGGEIRGYVMIAGALHLRLPNYAGDWPGLDAAVSRRLAAQLAGANINEAAP